MSAYVAVNHLNFDKFDKIDLNIYINRSFEPEPWPSTVVPSFCTIGNKVEFSAEFSK